MRLTWQHNLVSKIGKYALYRNGSAAHQYGSLPRQLFLTTPARELLSIDALVVLLVTESQAAMPACPPAQTGAEGQHKQCS